MTPLHTAAKQALDALSADHHFGDYDDLCTALREAIAQPAPEPVAWQFRWTNPGNNPSVDPSEIEWKTVAPMYPMTSIEDTLANLRAYRFDGKPCYEVRALYAAPPAAPAPGDMVPVPREPTPEMLFAGHMKIDFDRSDQNTFEMNHESQTRYGGTSIETDMRDCWTAMIAAAPPAAPAPVVPDLKHKPTVQHLMDLARKFRSAPGDLYDGPYKALQDACYEALSAAPVVREPQSREQQIAIREAHCNTASDEYFGARPQVDDATKRRIYEAGFKEGWESGIGGGGK